MFRKRRGRMKKEGGGSGQDDGPRRPTFFKESRLAHKYCRGRGIEIGGSAHNPFGLAAFNVDNTAALDTPFKQEEVRICGRALRVDIVAAGDCLPLASESQDFLVSSHVLEHFPNPIKTLMEWDRVVRPGGTLFMIIPHKERTFDRDRERTTLAHLIEDFQNDEAGPTEDENGHHHVWVTADLAALVRYMIEEMQMSWKLLKVKNKDDKVGNGFTLVIRKLGPPGTAEAQVPHTT